MNSSKDSNVKTVVNKKKNSDEQPEKEYTYAESLRAHASDRRLPRGTDVLEEKKSSEEGFEFD